jgi:hypothetical protein
MGVVSGGWAACPFTQRVACCACAWFVDVASSGSEGLFMGRCHAENALAGRSVPSTHRRPQALRGDPLRPAVSDLVAVRAVIRPPNRSSESWPATVPRLLRDHSSASCPPFRRHVPRFTLSFGPRTREEEKKESHPPNSPDARARALTAPNRSSKPQPTPTPAAGPRKADTTPSQPKKRERAELEQGGRAHPCLPVDGRPLAEDTAHPGGVDI